MIDHTFTQTPASPAEAFAAIQAIAVAAEQAAVFPAHKAAYADVARQFQIRGIGEEGIRNRIYAIQNHCRCRGRFSNDPYEKEVYSAFVRIINRCPREWVPAINWP